MHHVSGWVSASAIYMLVGDPVVLVASGASGAPKRLILCVSLAGLRRCPGSWWNIVRLWVSVRMAVLAHMCGLHAHCRGPREKSKVEKVRTCSLCGAQGPTPAASLVSSSKMVDALLHLQVPNETAPSQQRSRKAPLSLLSDEWPDRWLTRLLTATMLHPRGCEKGYVGPLGEVWASCMSSLSLTATPLQITMGRLTHCTAQSCWRGRESSSSPENPHPEGCGHRSF